MSPGLEVGKPGVDLGKMGLECSLRILVDRTINCGLRKGAPLLKCRFLGLFDRAFDSAGLMWGPRNLHFEFQDINSPVFAGWKAAEGAAASGLFPLTPWEATKLLHLSRSLSSEKGDQASPG